MRSDVLGFRGQAIEIPDVRVLNTVDRQGLNIDTAHKHPHTHGQFAAGRPDGICFHDTVTASTKAGFYALLGRKDDAGVDMLLGSGLLVAQDGTLYQIVPDLALVTWHASGWSTHKIGCDVVSLVDPKLAPASPLVRAKTSWSERQGYLDYTEAQKATLRAFVPILCRAIGAPFDCPRDPSGAPATRGYGKGPVKGLVPGKFKGCIGHAQVSKVRWDGNCALETLFGSDG